MTIQSIETIRELRDEIRKSIRSIKSQDYSGQNFGQENEYTAKGIITGIEAILFDVSALAKAPAKFIKLSTYAERTQIVKFLRAIQSQINSKDLNGLSTTIDQIKPIVRVTGIRHSNERKNEFDDHIDSLQKKSTSLTEHIDSVTEIKKTGEEVKEEIEILHTQLSEKLDELNTQEQTLAELINGTEESRSKIETLLQEDQERSESIQEILTESQNHNEVIDNFVKKVSQRESQLEDQSVATQQFEEKMIAYAKENEKLLEQAKKLIESAKIALEYKTAEGLSAAFTEKYNEAKKDWSSVLWIASSAIFIGFAIGIGIWLVSDKGIEIKDVIARISLLPMLIAGAWFSAGQYVKQKNIAEDYAYKSVLTKSIVGFSEQLKGDGTGGGNEYEHYIKSVLSQIHNDPLRKHTEHTFDNGIKDDMKKALDDLKGMKKIVEFLEKSAKQ